MNKLEKAITSRGTVLPGNILKVDSFLNHQVDPKIVSWIGMIFCERFGCYAKDLPITKILTAESSGIIPAMATAFYLGIPFIYAKKTKPLTFTDSAYRAMARSRTKGVINELIVNRKYINADDKILIIDDFLATGETASALIDIVKQSKAELYGVGCVIEKIFEGGHARLREKTEARIISLARIESMEEGKISFASE